jgi:hypothetical protein
MSPTCVVPFAMACCVVNAACLSHRSRSANSCRRHWSGNGVQRSGRRCDILNNGCGRATNAHPCRCKLWDGAALLHRAVASCMQAQRSGPPPAGPQGAPPPEVAATVSAAEIQPQQQTQQQQQQRQEQPAQRQEQPPQQQQQQAAQSPPLAGDNVMNVVLVGAECAPWSKTGDDIRTSRDMPGLHHLSGTSFTL